MKRPTTTAHRQTLLHEALAVMERSYAEALELDDVAHRVATSRRQLQRCFAEHGDGSFRENLIRIRMQRAAELLIATDATVRTIAARVGYRQPAQFAKAFAREHGAVPSEYRARGSAPSVAA